MDKTIIDLPTVTTVNTNSIFYIGDASTGNLSNISYSVLKNLFDKTQAGEAIFSGNDSTRNFTYTFPVAFDHIPIVILEGTSDDAIEYLDGNLDTSIYAVKVNNITTTNFTITYNSNQPAPKIGTNNLTFNWIAK